VSFDFKSTEYHLYTHDLLSYIDIESLSQELENCTLASKGFYLDIFVPEEELVKLADTAIYKAKEALLE